MRKTSPAIWKQKLDWIAERGGMALMNVHPDCLCFGGQQNRRDGEYSPDLYRDFLEDVRQRHSGDYWHVLPQEVAAHIRPHGPRLGLPDAVKRQMDARHAPGILSDLGRAAL